MTRQLDDPRAVAEALLAGHLAVIPTETVYGLAARADDPAAVARVFAVKGRPAAHPLIVHVADACLPESWVASAPDWAHTLAEAAWPGPLTLVVPRGPRAADVVTGGQGTVAIRVPAHPVALAVLRAMDDLDPAGAPHGIAAPSANRFGGVSPTTLAHALADLDDALGAADVAIDGGPCAVGIESTIVDATGPTPAILRPGGVPAEEVERIVGGALGSGAGSSIRVPGSLPSHYAPRAQVVLVADGEAADAVVAAAVLGGAEPGSIGLIAPAGVATPAAARRIAAPDDAAEYARGLYAALREADAAGLALVVAVPPDAGTAGSGIAAAGSGIAAAVLDRLRRAAAPR